MFESHLPLDAYRLLQLAITINHSQNKALSRILEKPLQKKAEKTIAPVYVYISLVLHLFSTAVQTHRYVMILWNLEDYIIVYKKKG